MRMTQEEDKLDTIRHPSGLYFIQFNPYHDKEVPAILTRRLTAEEMALDLIQERWSCKATVRGFIDNIRSLIYDSFIEIPEKAF